MSKLFKSYTRFLNSVYNYSDNIDRFQYIFDQYNNNISYIIDHNFTSNIEHYPIYDYKAKIITSMNAYDFSKIYNVTSDGTNYLIESIRKQHVKTQKLVFDKMPPNRNNYVNDYNLQFSYISNIKDIYDVDTFFELKNMNVFETFPHLLFNKPLNDHLGDGSFLQVFLLQNLFKQTYLESTDFLNKSILYFSDNNIINKQVVKDDFDLFIDNNSGTILNDLTKLILTSVYQFPVVSGSVINKIVSDISTQFLDIKGLFSKFSDFFIEDPIFSMCQQFNEAMANSFAANESINSYNNNDLFDQSILLSLTNMEDAIITQFKSKVSPANIQEYMYLLFSYKFWPFKFINNIPYVITNYVQNYLKTEITSSIDQANFDYYLQQIIAAVNPTNLNSHLQSNYTNSTFINLNHENKVSQFTMFLFFTEKLDLFLETQEFNDYLQDISKQIYETLSNETHINYKFNWYKNNKVMNAYFKPLFRKNILSNLLFNNTYNIFNTTLNNIMANTTGNIIYNTTLSFNETKIYQTADNLINYSKPLNNFFENHVTSTLISELSFDYISYFLLDGSDQPGGVGFWGIENDFIVS